MYQMTRPQLYIWYETTANRELNERKAELQEEWAQTANIIATIHNCAFGRKRSDMKKVQDFMPDFDRLLENQNTNKEELIKIAKEKGLETPENY